MGLGKRHELTDAAWAVIAPLPPEMPTRRGRLWADHRRVCDRRVLAGVRRARRASTVPRR
jgi:transposase